MSTLDTINIWSAPNDNTWDTIRAWWAKINDNFSTLNTDKLEASDITWKQDILAEWAFVDWDKTKLDWIEALADVTDTTNVTAAWALMDSEVDANIKTLTLPASTTISAFWATVIDDADASAARTTLDVDQAWTDNSTDVTLAWTPNYITIVWQVITRALIDLTTHITWILPIANWGTWSATKNFTDLTTTQTVGWVKTFSDFVTSPVNRWVKWLNSDLSTWYLLQTVWGWTLSLSDTTWGIKHYLNNNGDSYLNWGDVWIGMTTPNQKLTIEWAMDLKEQAAAGTDTAGYWQIWVKNTTPNELWFTDDAGTDVQLWAWGWWSSSAPLLRWFVAWELVVWEIDWFDANWTITAWTFRVSTDTLPTWANIIVKLYKNGTEDASCTITTAHSVNNWRYQTTDTSFVSWSYVAWDVITVEIDQVWSTVPWTNLWYSLYE